MTHETDGWTEVMTITTPDQGVENEKETDTGYLQLLIGGKGGGEFNTKMPSFQYMYMKSRYKDTMVPL